MDKIRFKYACDKIINNERKQNGIGTLGEKTLHAVLKCYFEPYEDNQEIHLGGYVADIVGENGVIEIQTRNFYALRKKLERFLEFCNVTVVFPIAKIKYLSWLDADTGEIVSKRKSPKQGNIYDAIKELYKIKYTLDNPRMNFCAVMLELEEIRYLNGWSKDKKRASTRCDRIPIDIFDEIYINNVFDYKFFIPDNLPAEFTSLDFAKCAKIRRNVAQNTINILCYLELIKKVGKNGKSNLYILNNNAERNDINNEN